VSDKLRKQIAAELEQLNRLFELHQPLLDRAEIVPTPIEISALGAVLHSFYNGIENIFKRIALELDGEVPDSGTWHRDLLDAMARATPRRPAVISQPLRDRLKPYLELPARVSLSVFIPARVGTDGFACPRLPVNF
jgi:hypothetical protein